MEKIKCCIKYVVKKIVSGLLHIFWLFPVKKNKILFMNDHSYSFSDNLKYLALYLLDKEPDKYHIYFSLKVSEGLNDKRIVPVKFLSLKHFYHALTSGVIITNNSGIVYLPIRKTKQLVINTWHGGGPYKVTGTDAINNIWYAKDMQYTAGKVDYILSSCKVFSEEEARGMGFKPEQVVNCGMPRMDFFFNKQFMADTRKKVFEEFDIPASSKLVIYAPTFRGLFESYDSVIADNVLEINYHHLVDALKNKFGGDWVFAVRLHPRLKDVHFADKDLVNMSYYPDAEELLIAADVLVTDYSSVMWDFSFSQKPVFLFAPDINDYEVKRGFYLPPEQWPYPIATTNDEMADNIQSYDSEAYLKRLDQHYIDSGSYEKGIACETVLQLIETHMKGD